MSDADDLPRRKKRRSRIEEEEDDAPPRRRKKKKKRSEGMSAGAMAGIGGGGVVLLIVVIVVAVVVSGRRGSSGSGVGGLGPHVFQVEIFPGQDYADEINLSDKKSYTIAVTSEPADPPPSLTLRVTTKDIFLKEGTVAEDIRGGKDARVTFTSPGFGRTPYRVTNLGKGKAICTIRHNGDVFGAFPQISPRK
jgi:hypothetical protein